MPDVFISYSKADKHHAERLAGDLKAQGLAVWWDDDLYASQDYHDAILQALNSCEGAIVIWSPTAVKSQWVRDEARRAHNKNKLVPTFLPPFTLDDIPLGFGDIQAVDVNDRPSILKALHAILPKAKRQTQPHPPQLSNPQALVVDSPYYPQALAAAMARHSAEFVAAFPYPSSPGNLYTCTIRSISRPIPTTRSPLSAGEPKPFTILPSSRRRVGSRQTRRRTKSS